MIPGKSQKKTLAGNGIFTVEIHVTAPRQGLVYDPTKTTLSIPPAYIARPSGTQLIWTSKIQNPTSLLNVPSQIPGNEQRNYKLVYALKTVPENFSIQLSVTRMNGNPYNLPALPMHMTSGSHYDLVNPGP
jgi:hypothetical protein